MRLWNYPYVDLSKTLRSGAYGKIGLGTSMLVEFLNIYRRLIDGFSVQEVFIHIFVF